MNELNQWFVVNKLFRGYMLNVISLSSFVRRRPTLVFCVGGGIALHIRDVDGQGFRVVRGTFLCFLAGIAGDES